LNSVISLIAKHVFVYIGKLTKHEGYWILL